MTSTIAWTSHTTPANPALGQPHIETQWTAMRGSHVAILTRYTQVPDRYRLIILDIEGEPVRRLNIDTRHTNDALDVAADHLMDVAR